MENRSTQSQELFSRSSTPPGSQSLSQSYPSQRNPSSSSTTHIDSLFHKLKSPTDSPHSVEDSASTNPASREFQHLDPSSNIAQSSSSILLGPEDQTTPQASTASNTERQTSLLSLLSPPSSNRGANLPPIPQQIPTPPGSSQRSGASPNSNDAKMLLEQLMGTAQKSSLSDSASVVAPSPSWGPSYAPSASVASLIDPEYRNLEYRGPLYTSHEDYNQRVDPTSQQQLLQSHQPGDNTPSPRKSMFDFSSPFDALSSVQTTTKKRTSPTQPVTASSNDESSSSWTSIQAPDPKRQSVDNLLENLTRGQPPLNTAQAPPPQPTYEPYPSMGGYIHEPVAPAPRAPLPIPPAGPAKANRAPSPRQSPPPPKASGANRQAPRALESPLGSHNGGQQTRREKESSPVPRSGSLRSKGNRKPVRASPPPQAQNIVFDVSQSLEEIQTSRDAVKSTPIALVKQDSVFLPGTTIGATHWVAYAMTRGRVRVISRSSGDRTLLQLPPTFAPTSSVTDMAVHGNYLAGVTSDGGFVLWQLPELITDDVPGTLLLNIPPSNTAPLTSVKWHPMSSQSLAVASESRLYLIDLPSVHSLGSQPLLQSDLHHISQVFDVPSSLVAFDFDVSNYTLATISRDSTLMLWSIRDRSPYATQKISGEDTPSSLTFVDGGLVIGRRNGTIFQLLLMSPHSMTVVSNLKFYNGNQDDYDMFGHVNYDSRIRTLWIANSRRHSLIAAKIAYDTPAGDEMPTAYFDQIVEFYGPKATIHFVILTAEADPQGDESHAACVAAKEPPGELALVAFSVHSSGVDQVLIRKEWYNSAFSTTLSKFPFYAAPIPAPAQVVPEPKAQKPLQAPVSTTVPVVVQPRTPQSEEVELELDMTRDDSKMQDGRSKAGKTGKAVGWAKEREEPKEKTRAPEPAAPTDGGMAQSIAREIKRSEESLHNRLGRLIGKEMDKQNLRLEEARVHDQNEDIARQEKLIKLISTELTKNTTRVVEMAVKNEVQLSVLPSLESIVKNEIKNTLGDHVGRGMAEYIGHNLPTEIERVFRRPDTSKHLSQLLSSSFTPIIETTVKDSLTRDLMPMVSQQTSSMHAELLREFRNEMYRMKTDLSGWQNEAFRGQEKLIRSLEHNVQSLTDQVKYLSANMPLPSSTGSMHHLQSSQSSSSPHSNSGHSQHRQAPSGSTNMPASASYPTTSAPSNFQGPAPAPPAHSQWYGPTTNIAAPQASHPVTLPQPPAAQATEKDRSPPLKGEQWDDIYLSVLHTDDPNKLRDLLSRTNPELVMPMHGTSLVSQAVVLTLIHRLSIMVGEISPTDETFKTYLWWLQRSVNVLNPSDKIITDFIPRVVPNIQKSLNATRQRLSILPVGPLTADTVRSIGDVSENLRRKANA